MCTFVPCNICSFEHNISKNMSFKRYFRLALACVFSLIFFSCNQPKTSDLQENSVQFDSLVIQKEKHLFNDTSKANASIELKLVLPKPNTSKNILSEIEKNFKFTLFGAVDPTKNMKELAEGYVTNYLKEYTALEAIYLKDQNAYKQKQGSEEEDIYEPMESSYNYQHSTELEITFNKANLLSYIVHRYDYTGGAHGMNTDSCFTITLGNGQLLKQEDLFDENALDQVAALIVKHIATDNNVKQAEELEELGFFSVKEIYPNSNFYVSDKGITWSYNPYDIAAYALGTISATVPFAELKPLLKQNHPLTAFVK